MKNLKKLLFSVSLILSANVITSNAFAFDKYITIKFKNIPSVSFIKELNKMTNTTVTKSEKSGTYTLKLNGVANNDTLDRYSELFSIMQDVVSVSPVPKEKIDDKVNPYYYMNNSTQENSGTNESQPEAQNNPATPDQPNVQASSATNQSGVITSFPVINNRDVKVTFKIGEEQEAMNWFNEVFGTQFVGKKGFSSYILRFPGNINAKMAVRALKVCPSVSNVEVSTD
jgi:hypothetical protein